MSESWSSRSAWTSAMRPTRCSMRSSDSVDARRTTPKTSYPFSSSSSARYEPSWPVTPVTSARLRLIEAAAFAAASARRASSRASASVRSSEISGAQPVAARRREASPLRRRISAGRNRAGSRRDLDGAAGVADDQVEDVGHAYRAGRRDVIDAAGDVRPEQRDVRRADVPDVEQITLGAQVADGERAASLPLEPGHLPRPRADGEALVLAGTGVRERPRDDDVEAVGAPRPLARDLGRRLRGRVRRQRRDRAILACGLIARVAVDLARRDHEHARPRAAAATASSDVHRPDGVDLPHAAPHRPRTTPRSTGPRDGRRPPAGRARARPAARRRPSRPPRLQLARSPSSRRRWPPANPRRR